MKRKVICAILAISVMAAVAPVAFSANTAVVYAAEKEAEYVFGTTNGPYDQNHKLKPFRAYVAECVAQELPDIDVTPWAAFPEGYLSEEIAAFRQEYPDLEYWVSSSYMNEYTDDTNVQLKAISFHYYPDKREKEKFQEETAKLKCLIREDMTDMEKAIVVHDWIYADVMYAYTAGDSIHSVFQLDGALLAKKAVCQGLSLLYRYYMRELNIPCVYVKGTGKIGASAGVSHGWNQIKLDGEWYYVDTTFDMENKNHEYFLSSENSWGFLNAHNWEKERYNPATSNKYDDAFWKDSKGNLAVMEDGIVYVNKNEKAIYKTDWKKDGVTSRGTALNISDKLLTPSVAVNDGKLYYTLSTGVYLYDFESKKSELVFKCQNPYKLRFVNGQGQVYYVKDASYQWGNFGTPTKVKNSIQTTMGKGFHISDGTAFELTEEKDKFLTWYGSGKASIEKYYTRTKDGNYVPTTVAESGAKTVGGAPSKAGNYFVKVTVTEDDTYKETTQYVPLLIVNRAEETIDTETKDTETKDTETKDTETKDTETKDTETKDTETKDTEIKDTEIKDTETKDTETKDTETQEIIQEETGQGLKETEQIVSKPDPSNKDTEKIPPENPQDAVMKYKVLRASSEKVGTAALHQVVSQQNSKAITVEKTAEVSGEKYRITEISDKAFKDIKTVKRVTVKAGITKIGKEAFKGCKSLKVLVIQSEKLKKIGKNALTGISKQAIIKVPAEKYQQYKKLLKASTGYRKTMKIRKIK